MRALDKLISFAFSVIMLILSVILILIGVGAVESQMIIDMLETHILTENIINSGMFNALTITGIVLLLASLKTTIFLSLFKTKDKSPILVKTQNGEIEIAQETITNIVRNVGTSFEQVKDVQAKMLKKRKGVNIYAMILVYANSNIRALTEAIQNQVKEAVQSTTGVKVLEINIKVKNIYQKVKKDEVTANSANTVEVSNADNTETEISAIDMVTEKLNSENTATEVLSNDTPAIESPIVDTPNVNIPANADNGSSESEVLTNGESTLENSESTDVNNMSNGN